MPFNIESGSPLDGSLTQTRVVPGREHMASVSIGVDGIPVVHGDLMPDTGMNWGRAGIASTSHVNGGAAGPYARISKYIEKGDRYKLKGVVYTHGVDDNKH